MKAITFALIFFMTNSASSPFNGAWLLDIPSALQDSKAETFMLRNGTFTRGGPESRVSVKVDGRFHAIGSGDYVDEVSVSILGPRKLREHNRLKGKLVYSIEYVVSADGNALVRTITDYSKPDARPISTTISYRRVGVMEKGAKPVSGAWQAITLSRAKPDLVDVLEVNGGYFSLKGAGGHGYRAQIGGPPVPIAGDAASARAAVTMPDDQTVVVNLSLADKPTVTMTMKMQPDGRTIKATAHVLRDGTVSSWLMIKQQAD